MLIRISIACDDLIRFSAYERVIRYETSIVSLQ